MSTVADTYLFVPGGNGGAAFQVQLTLEVDDQLLPDLTGLLDPERLREIDFAVRSADQPHDHARTFVKDGIAKLREGDFIGASPSLANGLESLYRATAESRGLIDAKGVIQPPSSRAGKKAVGADLVLCLPINERVQRMLTRFAFGDAANVYRHGGVHPKVDWKQQCLLWLLGIVAWLDGYGFLPAPIV